MPCTAVRGILLISCCVLLSGCAATIVGAAVTTAATVAVEVVKVPFKVGGAVIDAVSDDDEDD